MDVKVLQGETLIKIDVRDDEVVFTTVAGHQYMMHHEQDCCESVNLEDICGDVNDLLFTPLLTAEERVSTDDGCKDEYDESYTWTFYEFATIKGSVTMRWYGTSNGYYSESVDFDLLKTKVNPVRLAVAEALKNES